MSTIHIDLRDKNIGYKWNTDLEGEVTVMIHNESELITISWLTEEFKTFLAKSNNELQAINE